MAKVKPNDRAHLHVLPSVHGISKYGRKYPIGKRYDPPSEEMCLFLIRSLSKIGDRERSDCIGMAKRLIDLSGDAASKRSIKPSKVSETFDWLYQAGLIDYESQWNSKGGGYGLVLWKAASAEVIEQILKERPSYRNGKILKDGPTAFASEVASEIAQAKKCCDNPRPVRSKKTGKRKCKNCGRRLKKKKIHEG